MKVTPYAKLRPKSEELVLVEHRSRTDGERRAHHLGRFDRSDRRTFRGMVARYNAFMRPDALLDAPVRKTRERGIEHLADRDPIRDQVTRARGASCIRRHASEGSFIAIAKWLRSGRKRDLRS
jgi:hypothetical protein